MLLPVGFNVFDLCGSLLLLVFLVGRLLVRFAPVRLFACRWVFFFVFFRRRVLCIEDGLWAILAQGILDSVHLFIRLGRHGRPHDPLGDALGQMARTTHRDGPCPRLGCGWRL